MDTDASDGDDDDDVVLLVIRCGELAILPVDITDEGKVTCDPTARMLDEEFILDGATGDKHNDPAVGSRGLTGNDGGEDNNTGLEAIPIFALDFTPLS